jgi:hypothetical protein
MEMEFRRENNECFLEFFKFYLKFVLKGFLVGTWEIVFEIRSVRNREKCGGI